jgi:shikimate dehydrogenase
VTAPARLAVLGSPIAHSRSPRLHAAAYRVLGLDWQYEAIDVVGDALPGFLASRDASWRGLSLTMPLKRDVMPLLASVDETARLTGGANTVLFDRGDGSLSLRGFNTDVYGITEAFREAGIDALGSARILGGGATAASALMALHRLGARRVVVSVRTPAKAAELVALGERLGVAVTLGLLGDDADALHDAVVSTIPGHSEAALHFEPAVRAHAVLFDVAYDPWPSALARAWDDAGGTVVSGLEMLLHQAVAQVRVFVNGDPDATLQDEHAVLEAMRATIVAA